MHLFFILPRLKNLSPDIKVSLSSYKFISQVSKHTSQDLEHTSQALGYKLYRDVRTFISGCNDYDLGGLGKV